MRPNLGPTRQSISDGLTRSGFSQIFLDVLAGRGRARVRVRRDVHACRQDLPAAAALSCDKLRRQCTAALSRTQSHACAVTLLVPAPEAPSGKHAQNITGTVLRRPRECPMSRPPPRINGFMVWTNFELGNLGHATWHRPGYYLAILWLRPGLSALPSSYRQQPSNNLNST